MNILEEARKILNNESDAILAMSERLGENMEKAVNLVITCKGRVIYSGLGKSGYIAQKIASTMSSTGTPSFYLHPSECSHGDLGAITRDDLLVIISNSGNSPELRDLLQYCTRNSRPIIAMTGNPSSDLGKSATVILDTKVDIESCPFNLAPTTSTTCCLAIGDALAVTVMKKKAFSKEQYAEFHPGGTLGRKLLTRVKDVMHSGDTFPLVKPDVKMKEVITKMTAKEVRGVAGVVDDSGQLLGVVTDGDIRRRLEKSSDPLSETAKEVMSSKPKTIFEDELAEKALFMMEEFSIQTLFVLKENTSIPVGLIHLQDLLKAKLR